MTRIEEDNLHSLFESATGDIPGADAERLVALAGSRRRRPVRAGKTAGIVAVAAAASVVLFAALNRSSDAPGSVAAAPGPARVLVCSFALAGSESPVSDRLLEVRADGTPAEDQVRLGPFDVVLSVPPDRNVADEHRSYRVSIRPFESDPRVSDALAGGLVSTGALPDVGSEVGPMNVGSGSAPPISWVCESRPGT